MSDRFWGQIQIGGNLRAVDTPVFCRMAGVDESNIPDAIEGEHLVIENPDAPYGQFGELEGLCRELGLPYVRQSDGKYEFSPEIVFWRPGMNGPYHVTTDHAGNMQVAMDDVLKIRDALVAGDIPRAAFLADRAVVDLPEVPPFRIMGDVP